MNETVKAIFERRTVRKFDKNKEVGASDLELILSAARRAPSAMDTQGWLFTVIKNRKALDELNAAVFDCLDDASKRRISSRMPGVSPSFFYNAPVFIIVTYKEGTPYPSADTACAMQNMMLAAHSLGIGSCWINQLVNRCHCPSIRAFLTKCEVPQSNKVFACLALGYPAEGHYSAEKKLSENNVKIID